MTNDIHARAKSLIARRHVEGLALEDENWLNAHLAECEACAVEASRLTESLSALRAMHVDLPRNLASRTQLRIRLRAEELREHGPANRLIWAVAVVSWILGLTTAPWVWRAFEWAGTELGLPKLLWAAGVALWWIIPALAATGIVLLERKGRLNATE